MSTSVVVRFFIDAHEHEARPLLDAAERSLASLQAVVVAREIEPYWKEPGWHEVSFRLVVEDEEAPCAFRAVRDALGAGWTEGGDEEARWAVWNDGPAARFFDERVRFANLELAIEA